MRKLALYLSMTIIVLQLSSCALAENFITGDVSNYTVDYGESELYNEEDMKSATDFIVADFKERFTGSKLYSVQYMGDKHSEEQLDYVINTLGIDIDECICFIFDFRNAKYLDNGIPNEEVWELEMILGRKNDGNWFYVTHGAPYA